VEFFFFFFNVYDFRLCLVPHQCARPLIIALIRQCRERSDVDRLRAGRLSYLLVKFVFLILLPVSILGVLIPHQCARPLVVAISFLLLVPVSG